LTHSPRPRTALRSGGNARPRRACCPARAESQRKRSASAVANGSWWWQQHADTEARTVAPTQPHTTIRHHSRTPYVFELALEAAAIRKVEHAFAFVLVVAPLAHVCLRKSASRAVERVRRHKGASGCDDDGRKKAQPNGGAVKRAAARSERCSGTALHRHEKASPEADQLTARLTAVAVVHEDFSATARLVLRTTGEKCEVNSGDLSATEQRTGRCAKMTTARQPATGK
jgi:hypothetical protein